MTDPKREMLRHLVATIAYRGGKAVRGLTAELAAERACGSARSIHQLVVHIGDVLGWAGRLMRGDRTWYEARPGEWEEDVDRFYEELAALDDRLASDAPMEAPLENLMHGPLADVLTHIGQIAMIRRVAGKPIASENYFAANVEAGTVGRGQPAPDYEF